MVKLRFSRFGRKGEPTYRLVATDSHNKRDGRSIEELGYFIPKTKKLELNTERIKYWLSVGAQPTETIARMFVREGLMDKGKLPVRIFNDKAGKKSIDRKDTKLAKEEAAKAEKEKPAAPVEAEPVVEETTEAPVAEVASETVVAETTEVTETTEASE